MNLAFSSCVLPQNGQIPLGTINVFNGSGSTTSLLVKRHNEPTNVSFFCPLFTLCNTPVLSSWCMTPATEPPCSLGVGKVNVTSSADDPLVFEAQLQGASSEGGGEPLPDPERVVLAMFKAGIVQLPAGESSATLASTTINSAEIQQTLESYGVETIGKAFPSFDLADTVATTSSGQVVRVANLSEIYRLTLPELGDPQGLADELTPLVDVLYAHRDGLVEPAVCTYPACSYTAPVCPNDTRFPEQWALVNGGQSGGTCDADIDADEAWDTLLQLGLQPGSMSTKIAIHDWGIDAGHEDMMAKTSGDVGWSTSHGTFVAGIAAANTNNGAGIAGVDWNARLLSVRIDDNLSDTDTYNDLRRAAIDLGAHVVNASYSLVQGLNLDPRFSATVRLGFRDVYMVNRTASVAMGNVIGTHPRETVYYPAAFGQGIVAVGATDHNDNFALFSLRGSHIDVSAPGKDVLSSVPGNNYIPGSGTSFAAPHVAGIAGLLLAVKPWLDNDDIEQIVRLTAEDRGDPGFDPDYGTGRVNANLAVQKLLIPNDLQHLEAVGGTQLASDWQGQVDFFFVPPQLPVGRYFSQRYPVERAVTFPITFAETPEVWGWGAETIGYSTDGSTSGFGNDNYGMGWCEPVPGTITPSGCTLRTYVYKLFNAAGQFTGFWNPAPASGVKFAYSVLGQLPTTDVGDEDELDSRPAALLLSGSNPFRPGGTLRLRLPQDVRVELEVFDVAGRRVGRIHQGALPAGTHAIPWTAKEESGKLLLAGLYLVRLQAGTAHVSQKLVLLR